MSLFQTKPIIFKFYWTSVDFMVFHVTSWIFPNSSEYFSISLSLFRQVPISRIFADFPCFIELSWIILGFCCISVHFTSLSSFLEDYRSFHISLYPKLQKHLKIRFLPLFYAHKMCTWLVMDPSTQVSIRFFKAKLCIK